jgi:D-alanyl-D-alanine carboxypeptidase/D-alanyl-D-alanine-endopeptidase (penicillin-binding protein 4)
LIFAQSTSLNNAIAKFRNQALLTHASVGICLKDLQSGKIVGETEPQVSLTPASIQKVITGATALEILGPDFRFRPVWIFRRTEKRHLWGDLIILGGGDPALGSMYFREHYSTRISKTCGSKP